MTLCFAMAELSAVDLAKLSASEYALTVLAGYQKICLQGCEELARDDLSPHMRQFWREHVVYYENRRTVLTQKLVLIFTRGCRPNHS